MVGPRGGAGKLLGLCEGFQSQSLSNCSAVIIP